LDAEAAEGSAEDAASDTRRNPPATGPGAANETKGIVMTTAAHTPGPWIHDQPENMIMDSEGRKLVAQARSLHFPKDVRDANARLIAAAPDLLAALILADEKLKHYTGEYMGGPHIKTVRDAARAAITKAMGAA
jgi:hypothetical protein